MTNINIDISGDLNPIIKSANNILTPISNGLAGIFQFIFQKPIKYNIISAIELEELAKSTKEKINQIPPEHQRFNNMKLVGKILDDSIYQLDNDLFRNYYANLVSSSYDSRKNVKPFYSSLLRNMTPEDAQLFEYFSQYTFLFEINITCNNPLFTNTDLYRYYWPRRFFKAIIEEDFKVYRNFNNKDSFSNDIPMENLYKHGVAYLEWEDVENSVLFLLSQNVIQEAPEYKDHQFIPSIKEYVDNNDENIQNLKCENEDSVQKVEIEIQHKVYTLTTIGNELKDILTATFLHP